jgi:perosamine synthetase
VKATSEPSPRHLWSFLVINVTHVKLDERVHALVGQVLNSGQLAQGPMVERLEGLLAEAAGTRHAVAVTSGTTALVAALRALGIGRGDEVITSPFTFAATVNAILAVGATARFADIGEDFTMRPDAVESLLGERTAAIMPVDLYGLMADMPSLESIARRHGLAIVEDAAQAIGASMDGRRAGSYGLGCFSLYATKNITTGEGGAVTTDDDEVASFLRVLRNQGMRERYEYLFPGENLRITDLQAAVGIPQLEDLDEITARRRSNAHRLSGRLGGVEGLVVPLEPQGRVHVYHQYTVRVTAEAPVTRDELATRLWVQGVGSGVYYPRPAFDYPCYRDHPGVIDSDPVPQAFEASGQVLSLPVHPALADDDVATVYESVRLSLDQ